MSSGRIHWIDISRGLGIFFVIYGHMLNKDSYRYIIYSFHIPLFFFLSGVIFKYKIHQNFLLFLKKDFKAILVPYFIFAFLQLLFWVAFLKPDSTTQAEITKQFFGIFYGSGSNGLLAFDSVLWFLPCLFVTKVGFALLVRVVKSKTYLFLSLFIFSILGYLFSIFYQTIKLPFQTESALTAIVFFGLGYLWSHYEKATLLLEKYGKYFITFFIISCIYFAQLNFHFLGQQVDMRLNHLNNYFLFYLASFSGILACLSLSMILKSNRILEHLGTYSLLLFAWHPLLIPYLPQLFPSTIFQFLKNFTTLILPLFYTIVNICILLLIFFLLKQMKIQLTFNFQKKTH